MPIPKVFNLLFVLGEPKLYWLIPRSIGLSAYHTIFCTLSFLGKTNATVRTLSFSITIFFSICLPCFQLSCLAEVFELKKRLFLLIEVSGPATEARRSYSNRFARKSQTLVKKDPSSPLLDLRHFTINSRASGLQRKAAYDAVADSVNTYSCSSEGGACC